MRISHTVLALSAVFFVATIWQAASVAAEEGAVLTFEQIFEGNQPGEWPQQIAWNHDGSLLGYLLPAEGGGEDLWAMEAASGASRVLLKSSQLPAPAGEKAGQKPPSIDAWSFSPKGDGALVVSEGRPYFLALPSGEVRALGDEKVEAPGLAPNGASLAFIRNADLHLLDLASGKVRGLTEGGEPGTTLNGIPDWVYEEEIWSRDPKGYWWSPDSRRIAYYHFDETPIARYALVDFLPTYPEVEWQPYPKAGTANPKVAIGVVDVASGETTWLKTGGEPDDYLARVHWHPGGEKVAVERLNRDQNHLEILLCDARSGECSTLLTEEAKTWVNLSQDFHFLSDGRFLWSSERTGFRHLYLHGADGSLATTLTQGAWAVTSVDAVEETGGPDGAGEVIFTAFSAPGLGASQRRVFRVGLDGSGLTPLTGTQGWNEAQVAPGGKHWLHTASTADVPPLRQLVTRQGQSVAELPTGPAASFDPAALPQWDFITLWGFDGTKLPGRMLKPAGFDPAKKYPAIMYHYGCPASQMVVNRWDTRGRDLWHKRMAQRGYVVLVVDNITSTFFGKYGEDHSHRNFGPYNTDAQLAGVEFLKGLGYVDLDRIGLWGWSGGGSNTLAAVLMKPGVWKAAVAGAPVVDWYLYDTIWTERYLDHPADNPEGYKASSPLSYAANLKDALLIVHGTGDDNVHPQNTLVMSQAFIEAGVPFEQAIYPRQKHGFRGPAQVHFYKRMTDFFDRLLTP